MVTDRSCFFPLLSGNALKLLAALFMVIDHVGVILFPEYVILRIIGRLSYPLFAFMIAEGCCYTKNKIKYFLLIFLLGFLCQIVYYIFDRSLDMGILITFSISIILICALENFKLSLICSDFDLKNCTINAIIFIALVVADIWFCKNFYVDYGFWGTMAPVFACIFRKSRNNTSAVFNVSDSIYTHVLMFSLGLVILSISIGGIQVYSLLSILLLLMYSGKRGESNMKYFFYIFYPAHFIVLYIISFILN